MLPPSGALRAVAESGVAQLARALAQTVESASLMTMGVLALTASALERLAVLPVAISPGASVAAQVILGGYLYFVLRKAASGSDALPLPRDFRDSWDELIWPLLQLVAVAIWYWMPLLFAVHHTIGLSDFVDRLQLRAFDFFHQPTLLADLFLGLELLYLPPALLASVSTARLLPLLDPTRGWRQILRVPRGYATMFVPLAAMTWVRSLTDTAGALLLQSTPIPLVAPVIGHLFDLWVLMVQAKLVGNFAWTHRESLDAKEEEAALL